MITSRPGIAPGRLVFLEVKFHFHPPSWSRASTMEARKSQCPTCIFRPGNPVGLRPGRLAEIQAYLAEGTSHVCHHQGRSKLACRGGRDFQLTIWSRLGIIAEATDQALAEARAEAARTIGPGR